MIQELEIQRYLRGKDCMPLHAVFARLEDEYGISAKQHSRSPNLWLFKYSQIDSNFANRIVQECRGIILDSQDNWRVISFPFTKFMNYSEVLSAPIDWSTARVQEKLDGSLISTYFYKHGICTPYGWNVATSGCPDGTNKIGDFDKTFEELFWRCFYDQGLHPNKLNHTYTYMWELTSPLNRVVVDHQTSSIALIGVRNNITLQELPVSQFKDVFPCVNEYPLTSIESCLDAADKLNPLEHEGYVVVDSDFHRVKVKSVKYLSLHHLRDHCSLSRLAEVIRAGEYSEFSAALDTYPEIKVKFLDMVKTYEQLIDSCNLLYEKIKNIESQKEFAAEALKGPYSTILFLMRKTGKTPQSIIKDMTPNAYLRLMGIKNDL